jgi:hypothetical protein
MFKHFKNSIIALLIVTVMAPGLFLGIMPPKEAEAAAWGNFTNAAVGAGVSIVACVFAGFINGFLGIAFGGAVGVGVGAVVGAVLAVPTNEVNTVLLAPTVAISGNTEQTASATSGDLYKECVLDPLAWAAKTLIIEGITASILGWINDGFDGGPTFLTDPEGFFRDIAFAALDGFMSNSGLDTLLCEPFSLNVRMIVAQAAATPQFGSTKGTGACSLDKIFGPGFMGTPKMGFDTMVGNGNIDFDGGGIPAAMGLIQSGNNGFASVFDVQSEAAQRVGKTTGKEASLLSMGDGYFSIRCDTNGDDINEVCTPGQFVTEQIDDWMGGGLSQLEVADEISEIINAIVQTLVQKILTESGINDGLLGGA